MDKCIKISLDIVTFCMFKSNNHTMRQEICTSFQKIPMRLNVLTVKGFYCIITLVAA